MPNRKEDCKIRSSGYYVSIFVDWSENSDRFILIYRGIRLLYAVSRPFEENENGWTAEFFPEKEKIRTWSAASKYQYWRDAETNIQFEE